MCRLRDEDQPTEVEMESEKEEEDSEEESASVQPRAEQGAPDARAPGTVLTKAEHRELRGVKKLDYSWIRGLVTTKPRVKTPKPRVKTPKQMVESPKPMVETA